MAINPLSRREVLRFGAFTSVGGALTPGISMAQAIRTGATGIVARDFSIPVGRELIPAYDARPEAVGRYPVLVVISGFTGNSEQHKDVVRRFALAGFYAISPELYYREGLMEGRDFQGMSRVSGQVTRAQYLADIRAAADFARAQPWAAPRLGVTGFCGGGALTLHFAAEYPQVAAAAPWYGQIKRTFRDAPGVDALSLVDRIKCPVLGLYGEADGGIPVDDVRGFESELRRRNPQAEFILYADAPHAFFSDDRPQVYRKVAADDAWGRCLAFFRRHLAAT